MIINDNNKSIYTYNELTLTELLNKFFNEFGSIEEILKLKTDLKGNHEGSWQGLSKPTLSEEGAAAQIEKNVEDIEKIKKLYSTPYDFGANGDGLTDDTEALQEWLDYDYNYKKLAQGTFLVKNSLYLNSDNNTIFSEGLILANNVEKVLTINGKNNKISLNIDGNINSSVAIINNGYNIIENCNIENLYSTSYRAVAIETTSPCVIKNNFIKNVNTLTNDVIGDIIGSARAIFVTFSSTQIEKTIIENNIIDTVLGEEGDAIQILNNDGTFPFLSTNCVIKNNTIINCNRRAIKIQASDVEVYGNIHKNTLTVTELPTANSLINVISSCNVNIINNTLDATYFTGIGSSGSTSCSNTNIVIKNNTIKSGTTPGSGLRNDTHGIYCNYNTNLEVNGNSVSDGICAIAISNSDKVKINNNNLTGGYNTSSSAIKSLTNTNVFICNNTLTEGVRLYFIQINGNGVVINNFSQGSTSMIRNGDTSSTNSVFANNVGNCTGTLLVGDYTNQFCQNNTNIGGGNLGNGVGNISSGLAAPTENYHIKGELVINTTGGGVFGWRCIASGTPGTWTSIDLRTLETEV